MRVAPAPAHDLAAPAAAARAARGRLGYGLTPWRRPGGAGFVVPRHATSRCGASTGTPRSTASRTIAEAIKASGTVPSRVATTTGGTSSAAAACWAARVSGTRSRSTARAASSCGTGSGPGLVVRARIADSCSVCSRRWRFGTGPGPQRSCSACSRRRAPSTACGSAVVRPERSCARRARPAEEMEDALLERVRESRLPESEIRGGSGLSGAATAGGLNDRLERLASLMSRTKAASHAEADGELRAGGGAEATGRVEPDGRGEAEMPADPNGSAGADRMPRQTEVPLRASAATPIARSTGASCARRGRTGGTSPGSSCSACSPRRSRCSRQCR